MRLRIPLGVYVAACLVFGLMLAPPSAHGQEKRLVIASALGWETVLSAPATCNVSPCTGGGNVRFKVGESGFYTVDGPVGSLAFLRFGNVSFFVPPVGALQSGQRFENVWSDDNFITTVNVWSQSPATLNLLLGGTSQRCEISPPVTQCEILARLDGTLTIEKAPTVGCNGCGDGALYGFVAVGFREGGSVLVKPFGGAE